MKPQPSNAQEESLEPTFLSDDAPPLPFPTFVTKFTLDELFDMKSSDTLESILSRPEKKGTPDRSY